MLSCTHNDRLCMLSLVKVCLFQPITTPDMQKHPSSLAVLAKIFMALAVVSNRIVTGWRCLYVSMPKPLQQVTRTIQSIDIGIFTKLNPAPNENIKLQNFVYGLAFCSLTCLCPQKGRIVKMVNKHKVVCGNSIAEPSSSSENPASSETDHKEEKTIIFQF